MAEDIVRTLRIVEYVGPRSRVEKAVSNSLHGQREYSGMTIRAATIGSYPEILALDDIDTVEARNNG